MGGSIGQTLFGGSKQSQTSNSTSDSSNQAYDWLKGAYGGLAGNATKGTDAISAMLGVGGDPAAQAGAFNNFRNSTGYQQQMQAGQNAITSSAASRGLLNSGATLKGLNTFGQGLASQSYDNYMNNLFNLANSGFKAGDLISGAGQVSHSTSTSKGSGSNKPGFGGAIGSIATHIATGGIG